jgi:hypothetical protein
MGSTSVLERQIPVNYYVPGLATLVPPDYHAALVPADYSAGGLSVHAAGNGNSGRAAYAAAPPGGDICFL